MLTLRSNRKEKRKNQFKDLVRKLCVERLRCRSNNERDQKGQFHLLGGLRSRLIGAQLKGSSEFIGREDLTETLKDV